MKKCKCKTEDRRALFLELNGQNVYTCRVCGRFHGTRHLPKRHDLAWTAIYAGFILLLVVALMTSL